MQPIDQQNLITSNYDFSNNQDFNPYTGQYNAAFPSLLSNTGGVQDILNIARSHILGIQGLVPGALGSMGQANILSTMGLMNSGNVLPRSLGLGAIPDCGLADQLLGLITTLLKPLIDLLAALLGPLFDLFATLLGILSAILNELLNLLNLFQQLLNFGQAGQLLNLDPCSLLFMSQQGSQSLNNQINDGIIWRDPNATTIPDPGIFT